MKRGEVTLMILADFSKAFDTIKYKTVLKKLNYLGFSKSFFNWTIEYLAGGILSKGTIKHQTIVELTLECHKGRSWDL